jgi:hypothetical protein
VSDRRRLYSRAVVDFVNLDLEVILKFGERASLGGIFVISYFNTAHSLIELLVRLIFFFIASTVLVYLFPVDKSKSSSAFQLRTLSVLLGLVIVASNPLIILSYFTDSLLLPLFDAAVGLALATASAAGFLLLLEAKWDLASLAPFLIAAFLYFMNSILSQTFGQAIEDSSVMQVLTYARATIAAICFLRIAVAVFAFKSDVRLEKLVLVVMAGVTILVAIVCELLLVSEPLIASSHEVQIFTYASVATFVLFMLKFYWPVDPWQYIEEDVSGDEEELAFDDPHA